MNSRPQNYINNYLNYFQIIHSLLFILFIKPRHASLCIATVSKELKNICLVVCFISLYSQKYNSGCYVTIPIKLFTHRHFCVFNKHPLETYGFININICIRSCGISWNFRILRCIYIHLHTGLGL